MELTFRDVDRDDVRVLSAIADLWRRAYNANETCAPLTQPEALAIVRDCASSSIWRLTGWSEGLLVSTAFGAQVCENDGAGAPVPGHVLVRLVAVDAPFRGRGFGAATVLALLDRARESGFTHAHLWVGTTNAAARRLYERLGFHASGRSKLDDRGEPIEHLCASLKRSDGRRSGPPRLFGRAG